ncbi:TetR/AcrR family transcriptional regulator [Streptomyces sp. Ag109_O5-10]|uniref:TetR/AcrR family transcriptional regulator n=1 Tax=Streptomyces sp. Ag109_O5-10 TaxID=1855349 RepID=UPI00210E9849|nr:helix-turn-helix domain-containing protein [Streptomyces sp. Ag109_O5-10]
MPERPPPSAPKDGERPLRCDAARNRERIVHAAREVFGRRGLGVPLDDVAKHAGVGVGTMYRRFPPRRPWYGPCSSTTSRCGRSPRSGRSSTPIPGRGSSTSS